MLLLLVLSDLAKLNQNQNHGHRCDYREHAPKRRKGKEKVVITWK